MHDEKQSAGRACARSRAPIAGVKQGGMPAGARAAPARPRASAAQRRAARDAAPCAPRNSDRQDHRTAAEGRAQAPPSRQRTGRRASVRRNGLRSVRARIRLQPRPNRPRKAASASPTKRVFVSIPPASWTLTPWASAGPGEKAMAINAAAANLTANFRAHIGRRSGALQTPRGWRTGKCR